MAVIGKWRAEVHIECDVNCFSPSQTIPYVTELKTRNYKYLDTWPNTFQSSWPFPKVVGHFQKYLAFFIHVYSLLLII